MNLKLLKKIGLHCAVWVLAFCAVAISPVILIYSVPFDRDRVRLVGIGAGQILLWVVSAVQLWAFSAGRVGSLLAGAEAAW